jgi:cyclic pyranopterin phosphate synthase
MNDAPRAARRPLYLRLSVTARCNLRCRYCRGAGGGEHAPPGAAASDQELLDLVDLIDQEFPIYKLRITGGEPLARPGLPELVRQIRARLPGAALAMTTNATRLRRQAEAIRRAGVELLNVSLDTLDAQAYRELTRGGDLAAALDGLHAACAAGFPRVRLNTVLLRSVNFGQLPRLVRLAARFGCEPRFIELMPYGEGAALYAAEFLSGDEALESLRAAFDYLGPRPSSATARRHRLLVDGRPQTVGFITTVSRPFCDGCDRARLDSRGQLHACLRSGAGADLLEPYRGGRLDLVRRRIRAEIPAKTIPPGVWPVHSLVGIGG